MTHKGSRSRRIFKQRMEGRGHMTVSTATFLNSRFTLFDTDFKTTQDEISFY